MTSPLIASLHRSIVHQPARLAVVLLVAAAGCGGDAPVSAPVPANNGTLLLGPEHIELQTSFCVAEQSNFGAVGTGTTADGTPLVLTVKSPDIVSVRFGALRELAVTPPDAPRLGASATMALSADGRRISATGTLLQQPDGTAATPAHLLLDC